MRGVFIWGGGGIEKLYIGGGGGNGEGQGTFPPPKKRPWLEKYIPQYQAYILGIFMRYLINSKIYEGTYGGKERYMHCNYL